MTRKRCRPFTIERLVILDNAKEPRNYLEMYRLIRIRLQLVVEIRQLITLLLLSLVGISARRKGAVRDGEDR